MSTVPLQYDHIPNVDTDAMWTHEAVNVTVSNRLSQSYEPATRLSSASQSGYLLPNYLSYCDT